VGFRNTAFFLQRTQKTRHVPKPLSSALGGEEKSMIKYELELVSFNLCPYVQRSIIVLEEKKIFHKRTYIDLSNTPDWFKSISPLGRVPLLKVNNEIVFESAVICELLDEISADRLHPDDPIKRAKHRSWIEFGSSILDMIGLFYSALNSDELEIKRKLLIDKFEQLERNISDGPYFSGDKFHLVDAVYPTVFRYFDTFEKISDFSFFKNTPKVLAYREILKSRKSVKAAVKDNYAEELMSFLINKQSYISSLIKKI